MKSLVKNLLIKLLKNEKINQEEYDILKKEQVINEQDQVIPDALSKIFKTSKLYWNKNYDRILQDPFAIKDNNDYTRRTKLILHGYLSKELKPTGLQPTVHPKRQSVITVIKNIQTPAELEAFNKKYERNLRRAKALLNQYNKTVRLLHESEL